MRANEKRVTKTIVYDGSAFTECLDDWDVIMELRKKVYCSDNLIPIDVEFDEIIEKSSRHAICYGEKSVNSSFQRYLILDF